MDVAVLGLLAAGLLTGFSKFSVGGMGLLILPLVMIAVPGPEALGVVVPLYVITDLMAISLYRKEVAWLILLRLLPIGIVGIALGGWVLSGIDPQRFTMLLGATIIALLLLGIWLDHRPASFMRHPAAAYLTGLFAGLVSLIANAAGPFVSEL